MPVVNKQMNNGKNITKDTAVTEPNIRKLVYKLLRNVLLHLFLSRIQQEVH